MSNRQKNKSAEENKTSIGKKLKESVVLSNELMNDFVLIKMRANREIVVENYKGIIDYSDKKIYIRAKPQNIKITGSSLEIRTLTDEILYITGEITDTCFISEDNI